MGASVTLVNANFFKLCLFVLSLAMFCLSIGRICRKDAFQYVRADYIKRLKQPFCINLYAESKKYKWITDTRNSWTLRKHYGFLCEQPSRFCYTVFINSVLGQIIIGLIIRAKLLLGDAKSLTNQYQISTRYSLCSIYNLTAFLLKLGLFCFFFSFSFMWKTQVTVTLQSGCHFCYIPVLLLFLILLACSNWYCNS